jgi:hypothetical protein
MNTDDKRYRGNEGSAIHITYPRASRQTQDKVTTERYRQPSRPTIPDEELLDDGWSVRKTHTSAVRVDDTYSPRNAPRDMDNPKRTQLVRPRRFDRWTLVTWLCIGIIVMVGGWWLFSTVANWWTNWQNDLHYGNPRTYQTDQFVGQGDSPTMPDHFLAVNLNGRVVVVQLNLQHPNLDHTYGITTTDPKTPVSITFRPSGNTLAMYVLIETSTPYTVELVSDGKQFVSLH